jgi:hypothetical protein
VGREPASLGSPAYLSTTAPHLHMILRQNFWYLKMLFVIQTWQIYMIQVHNTYKHIYHKEYFLTLILAARAGNKLPNVYVFTEDQSKELKI